ncbi:hypothetical protein [Asanoa siamensis]|uniref:Galactose mutarotase-like enzyme n=1 Tax=Asanoa siamensis TaxID=926357 RepID=A0ABQ4CIX5_9ACTN|nr:hypothetical protein [Asanoa siamensis]GIF71232.1 hypothetical protein Asi02nite_07500 [Asanoa siamensis]
MVTIAADPSHGGRWTSLRGAGREWLWHRPDPARSAVRPGAAFVDAGGLEEILPTVRGEPDHGDAWSRVWTVVDEATATVAGDGYVLRRTFEAGGGVAYRLSADPGWRFVWAAHALLDLSPAAVLEAPAGTRVLVDGGTAPEVWPTPLARLGPDDGTATGAILVDCPTVTVADGERLTFTLDAPGQPVSTALWRNLRGWPADRPYRSIGVEPMLGRVWDLAEAGPADAAVVPASGVCEWRLRITALPSR